MRADAPARLSVLAATGHAGRADAATRGRRLKERAARLREKGVAALARHLEGEVGASRRVLTEAGGLGRTEQFTPVRLSATVARGLMLDVAIAGHDGRHLLAA